MRPSSGPRRPRRRGSWGAAGERGGSEAAGPFRDLLAAFERRHGVDREVREAAARVLLRADARRGLALGPSYPARLAAGRFRRRREERAARKRAAPWLEQLAASPRPLRVTVVSPEPTPYRSPLFDLVSARPEVELAVIYAAQTVAGRTWSVEPRHRSTFLARAQAARARPAATPRLSRHTGNWARPGESRPDVVVVSGWSTFASQAAIAWSRRRGVPYVPLVESHDLGPRRAWRRAVKGTVVPRVLRKAAGALALGTASRESLVARGADRERVRVFANTIDVAAWEERAGELRARRSELRARLGAADDDVVVLSVARLGPEKGLDTLVRAAAETRDARLLVVVAGDGPERSAVEELARARGVRLHLTGDLSADAVAETYVAADVFALLSTRETWGVVVNEAAASGLPLVLSNRVGARV